MVHELVPKSTLVGFDRRGRYFSKANAVRADAPEDIDPVHPAKDTCQPACDFLLHDGRACDAIEAAFLHDGPPIKKLGVIAGIPNKDGKCMKTKENPECGLNNLTKEQVRWLRAFLYSL